MGGGPGGGSELVRWSSFHLEKDCLMLSRPSAPVTSDDYD